MMCGRYGLDISESKLVKRYNLLEKTELEFEANKEIYPTTNNPVLLPDRKIHYIKWGFTPSFAKRPLINARAETILEKKTFREPFAKQRCLILATYFFEWTKEKDKNKKQKKKIRVDDLEIFSIAGICERYKDDEGQSILTYSIITTESNEQMQEIHHRMPVILNPEDENNYLNLETDPKELLPLLKGTERKLSIENVE